MYSLYSPYYVTKTSANGSVVYWSRDTRDNNTALLLVEVLYYFTLFLSFFLLL